MLKKKERLTKKEFDRSFSSGKRVHSPLFTLIYNKADDFHCAVVVGKKVYKKAVARNRLRRQVYGIVYRLSRSEDLRGVYMILIKPAAAQVAQTELRSEIQKLINKV